MPTSWTMTTTEGGIRQPSVPREIERSATMMERSERAEPPALVRLSLADLFERGLRDPDVLARLHFLRWLVACGRLER
jgi:hypothetical protein